MKVQDILTPLYQEASQQFATLLLGDEWMYQAMDMALCDIYSYEWNNWDFMNKTEEVEFLETDGETKTFTLTYPIVRVMWLFDIADPLNPQPIEFENTSSKYHVASWSCSWTKTPLHFTSLQKPITLKKNNNSKQWVVYYGWYTRPEALDDEIPIPEAFKSAFRDLTLHYILWPQWQYWEQKSWDLYTRWMEKLRHLSKSWLKQISKIAFK